MYISTTHTITVSVEPHYLDGDSAPDKNFYVWSYHVRIHNHGQETVQLKSRYWKITDAFGRIQEVQGDGVIGLQPILKPGEEFEYTSGTPLPTPSGIMTGTYDMETSEGHRFAVNIPAFSLDIPTKRAVH